MDLGVCFASLQATVTDPGCCKEKEVYCKVCMCVHVSLDCGGIEMEDSWAHKKLGVQAWGHSAVTGL